MSATLPRDPDQSTVIQEFHSWIASVSQPGTRGCGDDTNHLFIPSSTIEKHFADLGRIRRLLNELFTRHQYPIDPKVIQTKCLKVFCILLLLGKGNLIGHFCTQEGLQDIKLPFLDKPKNFPTSTSNPDFWYNFYKRQWVFCAQEFRDKVPDLRIEKDCVLPFIKKTKIKGGGSAIVYKIVIHQDYNLLRSPGGQEYFKHESQNTFVLKTYRTREAERYYRHEVDAFHRLTLSPSPTRSMIGFYGGFRQGESYNILLEYADMGTLEDYFRDVPPPTSANNIIKFWEELFQITEALKKIHILDPNDHSEPQIFAGWHQDVKPENILVSNYEGDSVYDCLFKLADMSISHFLCVVGGAKAAANVTDVDSCGTRAYGAPECCRSDGFLPRARLEIPSSVDIWSLGCVLSEAAIWLVFGYEGLEHYRESRMEQARGIMDGDCFHDGFKVLDIVKEWHADAQRGINSEDLVTGRVISGVIDNMLSESMYRPDAKQVWGYATRIIDDAKGSLSGKSPVLSSLPSIRRAVGPSSSVNSGRSSRRGSSQGVEHPKYRARSSLEKADEERFPGIQSKRVMAGYDKTNQNPPMLSVKLLHKWREQKKRKERAIKLPGEYLLKRLPNRDYVFLIDNSGSMARHWEEVEELFTYLSYLLKPYDPDGLELRFTASKRGVSKSKATTPLFHALEGHRPSKAEGPSNIESELDSILHDYADELSGQKKTFRIFPSKPVRPQTIYIFTNGIWQPECDAAGPIKYIVRKLDEYEFPKDQIGIQFIRFGDEQDGISRLEILDSELGLSRDIVDTEPCNGNVWKMLLGATEKWFDKQNEGRQSWNPMDGSTKIPG